MQKIYCVEDDESVRELVIYALQSSGFEAMGFLSAEDFFPVLKTNVPDLILLDIMLPGIDGVEILKEIRKNTKTQHVPVIMLTARGSEYDKITGLDNGADDYVTKPFGVMELIARIKAVLRRSSKITSTEEKIDSSLSAGNGLLVLNHDFHKVYVDNEEVFLTLKEFELLKYLMINKNMVLSRDQIMQAVWEEPFSLESRTIDMHIMSLRQKLGEEGKHVCTVRGIGYRLGRKKE